MPRTYRCKACQEHKRQHGTYPGNPAHCQDCNRNMVLVKEWRDRIRERGTEAAIAHRDRLREMADLIDYILERDGLLPDGAE